MNNITMSRTMNTTGNLISKKELDSFLNGVPDNATLTVTTQKGDRYYDSDMLTLTATWTDDNRERRNE